MRNEAAVGGSCLKGWAWVVLVLLAGAFAFACALGASAPAYADDDAAASSDETSASASQAGLTTGTIADGAAESTAAEDAADNSASSATSTTAKAKVKQVKPKPFTGKGVYYISLAKNAKKVLGPKDGKRYDNVATVLSKRANSNLLKFKITPAGKSGYYYIESLATQRLLTADTNGKDTAGVARMNAKFSNKQDVKDYQRWSIVLYSNKAVTFTHSDTGLRLSLAGAKTAVGTTLKLAKAKNAKNGMPLSYQRFKLKKTSRNKSERVVLDVPCYWQNPQLPTGCESVALTNALNYWGFGLSKTTIADRWMPYGSGGLYDFIGNPRNSSGWIICAPGITNTANAYLESKDSELEATNVSGTPLKDLRTYLDKGYPVVVWTTMYMGSPWNYSHSRYANGHRYPFYHNNHAVVLMGYNPKTGNYQVADSLSGKVWRSGGSFGNIYYTMGRQAVVIHDEGIDI